MSISLNDLYLWSRSNGEIQLVRPYSKNNGGKSYSVAICNRHGTEIPGKVQQASAAQLSLAVRLGDASECELKALQAARVDVLIFDNITDGKMIRGQIVNASFTWINVRYRNSVMHRKSHNVYLLPKQAVPDFVVQTAAKSEQAAEPVELETAELERVLRAAGAERGFILWNPKSTYAPTWEFGTLNEAKKVQRYMASKHQGETFHVCPVGPGLIFETLTTTKETFV